MAEREREGGHLQAQTALRGMQQLQEPKEVSLPVFSHRRDHGEKLPPAPRFPAPTPLPKAEPDPCKGCLPFSLATRQALSQAGRRCQAPQSLWVQDDASKATRSSPAWADWEISSSSSSQGSRGTPILGEGSAPETLCGTTNSPIYRGGSRPDTGTAFTPQRAQPASRAPREVMSLLPRAQKGQYY